MPQHNVELWLQIYAEKSLGTDAVTTFGLLQRLDEFRQSHFCRQLPENIAKYGPFIIMPMAYVYDRNWPGNNGTIDTVCCVGRHYGLSCFFPVTGLLAAGAEAEYVASFLKDLKLGRRDDVQYYARKYAIEKGFYIRFFAAIAAQYATAIVAEAEMIDLTTRDCEDILNMKKVIEIVRPKIPEFAPLITDRSIATMNECLVATLTNLKTVMKRMDYVCKWPKYEL